MTRWFEFVETSEQTALEAVRAYIDVLRFRRLVQLAEDNYVQHKVALDQIQSRVKAGVGRGVDLEQAAARYALAESNLVTELANLHDVSERYRRIVGEAPPAQLPRVSGLDRDLPASGAVAVERSVVQSAAVAAAIENLRSTKAQASLRDSAFQPKVEARVRTGAGHNFDAVQGQKRDTTASLVLNWNLYNGGADRARVRQATWLISQAEDLRDKACRDARQVAAIAHNDLRKLQDQLGYLDRNVLAIEKARDAYRQQFDIGQRTLLDLLNAENELYTARRAYAGAEHDLWLAQARNHAAQTALTRVLGLSRAGKPEDVPEAANDWRAGEEASVRCPIMPSEVAATTRADLDARARALTAAQAQAVSAPAPLPSPTAAAPIAAAKPGLELPVPGPLVAAPPVGDTTPSGLAAQRLRDWAAAWMSKDVARYLTFYGNDFASSRGSREKWIAERKRLVGKKGPIRLELEDIRTRTLPDGAVETWFRQRYVSDDYRDVSEKTLTWRRLGNDWVITKESNR
jgi:adhesin transport system outer membrane protein